MCVSVSTREREKERNGIAVQTCISPGRLVFGFTGCGCGRCAALCFAAAELGSCAPVPCTCHAHHVDGPDVVPADIRIDCHLVCCNACGVCWGLVGAGQEVAVKVGLLRLVPLLERLHALHRILCHLCHCRQRALLDVSFVFSSFHPITFCVFNVFVAQFTSHLLCMLC